VNFNDIFTGQLGVWQQVALANSYFALPAANLLN